MSDTPRLTRLRGRWAITWTENGGRKRYQTGETEAARAAAVMQDFLRARKRPQVVTTESVLLAHIESLAGRASHATALHQIKPLIRSMGTLLPMQITGERIAAYIAARAAAGRRPATIRSEVMLLSTALNTAMKRRLIDERPHIETPQDSPPRTHALTRAEFQHLLSCAATPHIRLFLILAISTGARSAAILDLTWDRVDLERGIIDLRAHRFARMKGRAIVPMTASARAALSAARQTSISDHVIDAAGKRISRVSKGVKSTAIRAALPFVSPHVLRHSAAIWMAEDGHSMAAIAQYLGHRDSKITERVYARYSPDYLRGPASALELGSFEPATTTHKGNSGVKKNV